MHKNRNNYKKEKERLPNGMNESLWGVLLGVLKWWKENRIIKWNALPLT